MKKANRPDRAARDDPTALVADAFGRLFEQWGFRSIVGKVWAVLVLSPDPVDADQLRQVLGVSSGTLSMAVRELVNLGVVYRESVEGKRRFFYRAETDMWIVTIRIFRERGRGLLKSVLEQLKEAERLLSSKDGQDGGGASPENRTYQLEQVRHFASIGAAVIGFIDAVMERTKVEVIAAQKWLSVSEKLGGEPLSRLRRAINASRMERRRR